MKRYIALDGWRGVCALGVALYHFPPIFWLSGTPLIRSGWLFVDFFFVLSGFVITHSYGNQIKNSSSTLNFMKRRFFRLYPLHLFIFLIWLAWMLFFDTARLVASKEVPIFNLTNLFHDLSFDKVLLHLSLLQGFRHWMEVGFNTPSWSISVEFWTYLLFALSCVVFRSRLFAVQLILGFSCLLVIYQWPEAGDSGWCNVLRSVLGFSVGSASYVALQSISYKRVSGAVSTLLEVAVVLEVTVLLWSVPDPHSEFANVFWLWRWLAPIVFMQVVVVFSFEGGVLSEVLKRGLLHNAGTYSYSIYMDHAFIIGMFKVGTDAVSRATGVNVGSSMVSGTILVLAFLCCVWRVSRWTYNNIERPGQMVLPGMLRHEFTRLILPRLSAAFSRYGTSNVEQSRLGEK